MRKIIFQSMTAMCSKKKYHNQSKPCWLLIELHRMWPFCDWPNQFWQKIWGKPIRPSFMLVKKKSGEIPSWTLFLFRYRIKASWVTSMSSNSSVHSFHSIFILQWLQKLYESLNVVYVFTVPTYYALFWTYLSCTHRTHYIFWLKIKETSQSRSKKSVSACQIFYFCHCCCMVQPIDQIRKKDPFIC